MLASNGAAQGTGWLPQYTHPVISGNSRTVAYLGATGQSAPDPQYAVYVVDQADGTWGAPGAIPTGLLNPHYRLALRGDGNAVVYNSYLFWDPVWPMYVSEWGSGAWNEQRQLSNEWGGGEPAMSADGTVVAYLATNSRLMFVEKIGDAWTAPVLLVDNDTPSSNSWQLAASLSTGRNSLAAVTVDGTIYALGGYTTGVTNLVEAYDATANAWSGRASLPTARGSLGAAVSGGKIYAIGGRDNNGQALAVVEEYDPTTGTWRSRAPMPTARYGLGVAAGANGRIYAVGGATAGFPRDVVEAYDPATDTWRAVAPLSSPREGPAVVAGRDGRIYVIGGYHYAAGWLATVEAYDPAADVWRSCADLALNRGYGADVLAAGGALYMLGGARGGGLEYVPAVEAALLPLPVKTYLPLILR